MYVNQMTSSDRLRLLRTPGVKNKIKKSTYTHTHTRARARAHTHTHRKKKEKKRKKEKKGSNEIAPVTEGADSVRLLLVPH